MPKAKKTKEQEAGNSIETDDCIAAGATVKCQTCRACLYANSITNVSEDDESTTKAVREAKIAKNKKLPKKKATKPADPVETSGDEAHKQEPLRKKILAKKKPITSSDKEARRRALLAVVDILFD